MTDTLDMWVPDPEEVLIVDSEPDVLDVAPPMSALCLECMDEIEGKTAILEAGSEKYSFCNMVCACKWRRKRITAPITTYLKVIA